MPLLSCENISKTYGSEENETRALRNVTFSIEKGEFVSIMGPSGSGKSTLMHILGMLDKPTQGRYAFQGRDVSEFDDNMLARIRNQNIGFVFQAFNLLPRTSVFENVELPLLYDIYEQRKESGKGGLLRGMMAASGTKQKDKVLQALRSVGMDHRVRHMSGQLSGGEKQRVAIARALVNDPDIVFADEPTGNLDSKSGLQVMRILQGLNETGRTVILVTHETYTAEHAKRILRMMDGELVSDEPVVSRRNALKEFELLK